MIKRNFLQKLILPRFTKAVLCRIVGVTAISFLVFRYLIQPISVQGLSMEPTISHGSFHFYSSLPYLFGKLKYGDIVVVRLAGKKILLLKRVIGLPGDTISFVDGKLIRNGNAVDEPYLHYISNWNVSPKKVDADMVYIVGDNRSVPVAKHRFGQVVRQRILGEVLF